MESFLLYIGKAALGSGTFYLAYLALFQHQKHFLFNRIYLPVSLAISFLIPLITFTKVQYIQPVETTFSNSFAYLPEATVMQEPQFTLEWFHYLLAIYLLGNFVFLINLLLGHLKAMNIIRFSRLKELFGAEINLTKKDVHPFSFFKRIVLSEKTLENPNLKMIVDHEMVHVKERHTFDILFAEVLFLFQWFNPFAWLIRDAMRNNLEYLTDHQVTQKHNAEAYQLAMVGLAHKKGVAPFLTALNGSQLKNRIIMMKKKTENRYSLLKQLVVLPLLAILVMGLSNKEVKTEIVQNKKEVKIVVDGKEIPNNDPSLASIDFSKGFEGGEIVDALNLNEKVESNFFYINEETNQFAYYVRTSDYVPGSNAEFDKITSNDEQSEVESYKAPKMLYAVDGKIIETTDAKIVAKQDYESASILSGDDAVAKYGEQAKDASVLDLKTGKPNVKVYSNQSFKELTVKGKITNEKGEPVSAVAVLVRGTTNGTISDFSGDYEIQTSDNSTLVFSMVGYEKREVAVEGKTEINIDLVEDTEAKDGKKFIDVISSEEKDSSDDNAPEGYSRLLNFDTGEIELVAKEYINGKVTDINGNPVSGVTVFILNKTIGDKTDANGNYKIETRNRDITLATWADGYKDQTVEVDGRDEVNIQLISDGSAKKDEIKGIGYGQQKSLSDKEKINIDLSGDTENSPLYYVDGIENKNIDWLSPNQIENISVLKGESATALYGDKAKNGVVIVTTKFAPKEKLNEALMIVDGKIYDGDVDDFDPETIESIDVLKDASATKIYGPKAKNGAVIIKTKNAEELNGKSPKVIVDGKEYKGDINDIPVENISSIEVRKKQPDRNIYDGKGPEEDKIIIQTKTKYNTEEGSPVIIIDGVESEKTMDDIDPESIMSMSVFKGDEAIKKYGNKAKNGAIVIVTKDYKITSDLELRKFIAREIVYPKSALEMNQEGLINLIVRFNSDGSVGYINDKTEFESNVFDLDEVIVTAMRNSQSSGAVNPSDSNKTLKEEVVRVIEKFPLIEIPQAKGKMMSVTVKFVLQ